MLSLVIVALIASVMASDPAGIAAYSAIEDNRVAAAARCTSRA